MAVTSWTRPGVIRISAWPPPTRNDRVYVVCPSAPVVTVHPSTVAAAGAGVVAARVAEGFREGVGEGGVTGGAPVVTEGAAAGRSTGGAATPGVAVRSTGWSATVATPMLARVAAHQPTTGTHPRSRMRPLNHRAYGEPHGPDPAGRG
ncbi:hypothetical protein Prum_100000 [Phytohabitans rumicis]|uniref:Uncharacterized protein n=1 Tax=Phytohabitans rumicis TaxID=1076125 RepID=A0A6V8LNA6_9ACTN|nr:hypothetical protein Prum_100000 [Phytohabitans rumicis]